MQFFRASEKVSLVEYLFVVCVNQYRAQVPGEIEIPVQAFLRSQRNIF